MENLIQNEQTCIIAKEYEKRTPGLKMKLCSQEICNMINKSA